MRSISLRKQIEPPPTNPEIIVNDSELFILGNDRIKHCSIRSNKCELFHTQQQSICSGVHCTFSTNNTWIASITARSAYVDHARKQVFLPGTILGTFQTWKFTSQNVFYNSHTHTMTAIHNNISDGKKLRFKSKECKIDLKKEQLILKNNVECRLYT